jgi:hypothetical protein
LIIWATEVNKKTEQGNGSSDIWLEYSKHIQRYFRIGNPFTSAKENGVDVSRGCLRLRMSLTTNWHSTHPMARYINGYSFF